MPNRKFQCQASLGRGKRTRIWGQPKRLQISDAEESPGPSDGPQQPNGSGRWQRKRRRQSGRSNFCHLSHEETGWTAISKAESREEVVRDRGNESEQETRAAE